ncbi:MAG: hypothetical protein SFY81_15930 [Verrucomicrobiota bacterium]|nr:hypothetical protein [Verrucomicrobiota bacterium]
MNLPWAMTLFLAALLGLASGCAHTPFYPVGIYGINDTNELAEIRSAGFNTVCTSINPDLFNAVKNQNLKLLAIVPNQDQKGNFDPVIVTPLIRKFDSQPTLFGWQIADEPDLWNVPPDTIRSRQRLLKSLGAKKPTTLVLLSGTSALHYGNIADITMNDRYPVGWQPLSTFAAHLKLTRATLGPDKPMFAVIQAFNWSAYPHIFPPRPGLRPPTREELRCMTYMALANQADGIFYYCYQDSRWNMPAHPETWADLKQVVAEINSRHPLFAHSKQLWWPYEIRYTDRSIEYNEVYQASISLTFLDVAKGSNAVPRGRYFVAVNTTPHLQIIRFKLPMPANAPVPVLDESRSLLPDQQWITDEFTPFAVHVYGPLKINE